VSRFFGRIIAVAAAVSTISFVCGLVACVGALDVLVFVSGAVHSHQNLDQEDNWSKFSAPY
jgi:hypothetical protein